MRYSWLSRTELNDEQITAITNLLFTTGYYHQVSQDNYLELEEVEFQKQVTILPLLNYIRVMIDNSSEVIGFHMATPRSILQENSPNGETLTYNEEAQAVIDRIDKIYFEYSTDDDLILHNIAINDQWQGQGLFKIFLADLMQIAKKQNCRRLVFGVWYSKENPIAVYKKYGAVEISQIDFHDTMCDDKLLILYLSVDITNVLFAATTK